MDNILDRTNCSVSELFAALESRGIASVKTALVELLRLQDEEREYRRIHGVQYLDLPPELRVQIYGYMFRDTRMSSPFNEPEILHSSSLIRTEARPVFYSNAMFDVAWHASGEMFDITMRPDVATSKLWKNLAKRGMLPVVRHLSIALNFHKGPLRSVRILSYNINLTPDGGAYTVECNGDEFRYPDARKAPEAVEQKTRVDDAMKDFMVRVIARVKEQKWLETDVEAFGQYIW
ncbi:hypothetical protein LTR95_013879 [Oleoguttula sp. CCFEE 5521]